MSKDVQDFTSRYGLSDNLSVFQEAARLLNEPGLVRQSATSRDGFQGLSSDHRNDWKQSRTLYFTIFVCALGAIEQGWAQTAMNGANLYIADAFNLDRNSGTDGTVKLGAINCGAYLGVAFVGAWLSEPANNCLGRRGAIFLGTFLCLIANAAFGLLQKHRPTFEHWQARPSWVELFGFRVLLGIGLGINASTVSVFAAESSPANVRGRLGVSWQMFVAFGILLGFLANASLFYIGPDYQFRVDYVWRLQLAAPALPAFALLLLIYRCPESPSWHIKQQRYDRAFISLCRLRKTELQAACELYSIYFSRSEDTLDKQDADTPYLVSIFGPFRSLFTVARNRRALYASYTVMLSQQLCGINIIAFYSTTIFAGPGKSLESALWASVIFGLVNFLGAFPAIWTMDSFGRRGLLLWTLPPMALTMAFMAMTFSIPSGDNNVQLGILAALIYTFCALYSPGMGPIPCAYSAECYSLEVREVGMSMAIATANFWATVLSLTFPVLLSCLGQQTVFALYAVLNVLAWVLCWLFVRETKGIELEKMDSVFESTPIDFIRRNWAEGLAALHGQRAGWTKLSQDDATFTRHID